MEVETIVFWSADDTLAGGQDVLKLLGKLKHFRSFRIDNFRHVDFLLSIEAQKDIYEKVLQILDNCCLKKETSILL